MDLNKIFETFYQHCDVKKEIELHSLMLKNDTPGIRMIKDDTFEEMIRFLMLKSFAKGAKSTLESLKKVSKFEDKLAEA
jgi:hypothetical protein